MPIGRRGQKPTLRFEADDIKEFAEFSIGDIIIVRARGKIINLSTIEGFGSDEKPLQQVSIELESITAQLPEITSESRPKHMSKAFQRAQKSEEV